MASKPLCHISGTFRDVDITIASETDGGCNNWFLQAESVTYFMDHTDLIKLYIRRRQIAMKEEPIADAEISAEATSRDNIDAASLSSSATTGPTAAIPHTLPDLAAQTSSRNGGAEEDGNEALQVSSLSPDRRVQGCATDQTPDDKLNACLSPPTPNKRTKVVFERDCTAAPSSPPCQRRRKRRTITTKRTLKNNSRAKTHSSSAHPENAVPAALSRASSYHGYVCGYENCTKRATGKKFDDGSYRCVRHGGGTRRIVKRRGVLAGGTAAQADDRGKRQARYVRYDTRCNVVGCNLNVQGRSLVYSDEWGEPGRRCISHGGGTRCNVGQCTRLAHGAVAKMDSTGAAGPRCLRHGGVRRKNKVGHKRELQ
eukprot:GEMP01042794.1.p1 GENE.GEMP01042794.1~~GEMP01042794.1.p1  ORF type:complete len:370 (+),score=78.77 GEMP01042794.1:115-1224(+)